MKQRSIQFSALLIVFLVSGIGSALAESSGSFLPANVTAGNMSVIINYNATDFRPGLDTVNITADFNTSVPGAMISITPNLVGASNANLVGASNVNLVGADLPTGELMTPLGENGLGGNSFGYEFPIPEGLSGLLGVDITPLDSAGNPISPSDSAGNPLEFPDFGGFGVDPYIEIISPESEFANESCVNFNFSAHDYAGQAGNQITYAFLLDGVQKDHGIIASGAYKQLQFELADGSHTWEVKTNDGQAHTSGIRTLYVDTQCPSVKLISPGDCFKEVIGSTTLNFTCEDALTAQYASDLDLSYTLYVDGQPAGLPGDIALDDLASESGMDLADLLSLIYPDGTSSGVMESGEYVVKKLDLDDGVHYWYVSVEDEAGNSVTSEVRKFYVSLDGLTVTLVSPSGGQYVSSNPTFNFNVTGKFMGSDLNGTRFEEGAGLPFDVKLLIDGKEVEVKGCDDCDDCDDCNEGENICDECGKDENDCDCPNCDEKENDTNCVSCAEGDCDECCFFVGERTYSVTSAVPDGINKNWTVIITDSTSGKTYPANVLFDFSVDSVAPAAVANLNVEDALGKTSWQSTRDYPGLMVSWNASTDTDLASMPYEVYISTSKPGCIEDMQMVNTSGLETHTDGSKTPNQQLENSSVTNLCIEALDGEDIVYGKDYWVAVIARDNASNYNSAFSMCGPVQTYEDMDITLQQGWNLKSVPKRLVESNDCTCASVFGEGSTVLYWDGSCWQFPETIEPCKGYWVYTPAARVTNVKFKGMLTDGTNPDVPASLELTPGWHMIGHTASYATPWSQALVSLYNLDTEGAKDYRFSNLITYSQGEGWGGIIPGIESGSSGSLSENDPKPVEALQSNGGMVPGQGYWIFMKDEGTYASIENTYNLDIGNTNDGNGGFPAGFDLNDPNTWPEGFDPSSSSTWPEGFSLSDGSTWPAGFDMSEFLNLMQT